MKGQQFTTNEGDYLIIQMTGGTKTYIAEVIQSKPLQVKIQESGPYAKINQINFIILEVKTAQFQKDCHKGTDNFLEFENKVGRKVISGLKSLGIIDEQLHEMLPTCKKCKGTGVYKTGNNDLPCDCPAGDTALFNVCGISGPVTGAEMKRHFLNGSPEPIELGRTDILASSLPGR